MIHLASMTPEQAIALAAVWWLRVSAVLAAITVAWRALPRDKQALIEQKFPRAANAVRFARAMGPDVIKALLAAYNFLRGNVWRQLPPLPPALNEIVDTGKSDAASAAQPKE